MLQPWWETPFAFSQFEQIEQRKLHTECWTGLGKEALVLFTRKGLFLAWVTATERDFPPLCNVGYLRENSWARAHLNLCKMEWDAGEYGPYCMAVKVSFFPCLFGGMWGCPQPCLESPQKELGEVEGVAVMWQAVPTNRKEGFFFF